MPPHTSNKLQPLDVAVYGPLKVFFEQEINRFQKAHPGRIINQYDVAKLFSPAYLKCATANNAIKGFQTPGIWPTNIEVWGEEHYAPSSTTMAARSTANPHATIVDSISHDDEQPSTSGLQRLSRQSLITENSLTDCSNDGDMELFEQARTEPIEHMNVEVEDILENNSAVYSRDIAFSYCWFAR